MHSQSYSNFCRLNGNAAVKAKNVCLNLVDQHEKIIKSGLVQLFSYPHPAKCVNQSSSTKTPPRWYSNKQFRPREYRSYQTNLIMKKGNMF